MKSNSKFRAYVLTIVILIFSTQGGVAHAAATQADVDYSTQLVQLTQEFAKVTTEWSTATAKPPTLAFGSKYNAYKAKALKTSDAVITTAGKFKALTPSAGFKKSGPLLKDATGAFQSAASAIKIAISKNDSKLMAKANLLIEKASTAYATWSTAYAADLKVLNG